MSWIAVGAAAAGVAGAALSSDASRSASQTQAKSGQNAINEQVREFNIGQQNLAPYQSVGQQGLYLLQDALGIPGATANLDRATYKNQVTDMIRKHMEDAGAYVSPGWQPDDATIDQWGKLYIPGYGSSTTTPNTGALTKPFSFDISQDPGYQFRLDQGTQAIQNSASAKGSQLSGATLKELLRYGQDYASGEFNTAFQRDQATKAQLFGILSGTAGVGQGATNTSVAAGQSAATNIGNTMTGIGNAQAAGQIGQANAAVGGINTANQGLLLRQAFANQNPGVQNVNSGVNLGAGLDV